MGLCFLQLAGNLRPLLVEQMQNQLTTQLVDVDLSRVLSYAYGYAGLCCLSSYLG